MEGSVAEMAWEVGDHGFEMTLGAAVPDLLRSGVGPWVRGILAEEAIDPMAVGGWAIHPGGPRVIDAVLESLALEPRHGESSRAILRDFGNMSSATLLFIMRAMRERGIPRPWVALAFGPGIAGEALLLA
jgi:predicted naringenin-chalcone synthase